MRNSHSDSAQEILVLVGRILSAVRNSRLYPEGHPILEKLLDDSYVGIIKYLRERDQLEFRIAGNVLIVNGTSLKESKKVIFSEFITLLGSRQVGLLAFLHGIDRDEFISFLNILALESEELQNRGGFSRQLSERDIQHIIAKDISYESTDRKGITLDWGDFYGLLSAPQDLMAEIERSPESVAESIEKTVSKEFSQVDQEDQWASSAVNVLQKMADSLFEAYGRTQPEEYAQGMARIALALNPSLQNILIDTKGGQQEWSKVVEIMISKVPDEKLVELVVEKFQETSPQTDDTVESGSRGEVVEKTEELLRKIFADRERKDRLLPILKKKLGRIGFAEDNWRRVGEGTSPQSKVFSLFEIELSGRPPLSVDTLVTIKMALEARTDIEKLIHPFITAINEENPDTRRYVSEKLRNWASEIIALGRYDLVEEVIHRLSQRLRTEDIPDVYESLVMTLKDIALLLLAKEKRSYSNQIITTFVDYLGAVKDQPQGRMLTAALGEIGGKTALKELINLLGDTELDSEASRWIIEAGSKSIEPLLWALRIVEDKNTRLRIIEVLSQLGEEVLPAIKQELRNPRWYVRRNACTVLSRIPQSHSLKPLSTLLRDDVPQVRREAVIAIAQTGGEKTEDLILPMTTDKKYSVQHAAIKALGEIGSKKSVVTLIDFLQSSKFRGKKAPLGKAALRTLGAIGHQMAKEFLIEVVEKQSWRRSKYSEEMRKESIEMLGRLGEIDCRVALLKATKDKSELIKATALSALKKLGSKDESSRSDYKE